MSAMKTTSSLLVLLVAAMLAIAGCASGGGIPSGDPMPDDASYSGLWYSEQFDHMYLYQDGDEVEGVYVYGGGGTIEGQLDGNVLLFSWEEPGDRQAARQGMNGQGYLQLVGEGDDLELIGEWGYNDDRRGAGPWEAEFIRQLEEDDPKTLEDLREAR